MTLRSLALVLALSPLAASAQVTPVAAQQVAGGHLLEIRDGGVWLDGAHLADAVPPGLDLSGMAMHLDYSGPITPVVEVDGQAYVLEHSRLVRFEESTRAGEQVYVLGDAQQMPVGAMDDDRLALVSQEAYLRELAERDRALYQRVQEERALEDRVADLAQQVRRTPAGADRTHLHGELRSRLSDLFTLKQQVRREEVDRAQAQLDSVRSLLDEREAQRDAIIDGRMQGLCGE